MAFIYGDTEISYLRRRDKRLSEAIDAIGYIERGTNDDLFSSLVNSIVGQQISSAAQATIWGRMQNAFGAITAEMINGLTEDELQGQGLSFRKARYIKEFADTVGRGALDIDSLHTMTDSEVVERLTELKGVGVWTAEMLMIFSMQRPDILSCGDLAIHRGMRMLYRHRSIDRELFEKYRRRYSPYGSVASLYLWAVAGGAIPELKDPGEKKKR